MPLREEDAGSGVSDTGLQEIKTNASHDEIQPVGCPTKQRRLKCILAVVYVCSWAPALAALPIITLLYDGDYCTETGAKLLFSYLLGWTAHIITEYIFAASENPEREGVQSFFRILIWAFTQAWFAGRCNGSGRTTTTAE